MNEPLLYEATDLWKSYSNGRKEIQVLRGVNLAVKPGETVAVTGPSGVGKSTLLHILGLLDRGAAGRLILNGADVNTLTEGDRARLRNRRIGFVFQFFQLLLEFTAHENVCMPGMIAGRPMAELKKKATALLDEMGLADRADHRPGELSGGEQQRVAIARALINDPDVVLADEPTGNLDPATGAEIEALLRNLNRSRKATLIVATHNQSLARAMDRRVGLMGGKIQELQ
jgi:lipoprotein-releasing system ATP-binding protein